MRAPEALAVVLTAGMVAAACADGGPTVTQPASSFPDRHSELSTQISGDPGVSGGYVVQPLARGDFPDDIDMTFRIKLSSATKVVAVQGPSDALAARIIFQPGGSIGWHTHPGPVIVTVASGALSIINASDCVHRVYAAGKAFIDPGQGNVHVGFNETDGETVVYATFLDVPAGQPATIPADNPGCSV